MDNFGIDDELLSNLLVFILEAGMHPKYLDPLLVFSLDGNPIPGNRQLIHNRKGVYHEVKVLTTGSLRLGPRRKDIEAHNVHPPDRWSIPITPTLASDPLAQLTASSSTEPNKDQDPFPHIDTPVESVRDERESV